VSGELQAKLRELCIWPCPARKSVQLSKCGDNQRRFIYWDRQAEKEKAPRCMYQLQAPLRFPRVSMCSWSVIDILSYKNAQLWIVLLQTQYLGLRIYAESSECMITIIICYKLWYIAIAQLVRRDVVVKNKELTATIFWQVWTTTTWPKVNISHHESTKLRSCSIRPPGLPVFRDRRVADFASVTRLIVTPWCSLSGHCRRESPLHYLWY